MREKHIFWIGGILLSLLAVYSWNKTRLAPVKTSDVKQIISPPILPDSVVVQGYVFRDCEAIEGTILPNQRFVDMISGYAISPQARQMVNLVKSSEFRFALLQPRKKYTLVVQKDSVCSLKMFAYDINALDYVAFHFGDSLRIEKGRREVTRHRRHVAAGIQATLAQTIEAIGISYELTNKFVDIFDWRVDFQRIPPDSKFKIVYDELRVNGKQIGIEAIRACTFEIGDRTIYAFGYDQGKGMEYFNEKGESCQAQLMKYPIEFSRISSRYSMRRFHPVSRVMRPHLGTDFAAPTGTPIRSVGDGIVEEASYKANNGNYVMIRHNKTYTTGYLHMSKIAAGMYAGKAVTRGQVIGYVGSTGLATGPHLCYRFWKNGRQVDALRVNLPSAGRVKKEKENDFAQIKEQLRRQLDDIPYLTTLLSKAK